MNVGKLLLTVWLLCFNAGCRQDEGVNTNIYIPKAGQIASIWLPADLTVKDFSEKGEVSLWAEGKGRYLDVDTYTPDDPIGLSIAAKDFPSGDKKITLGSEIKYQVALRNNGFTALQKDHRIYLIGSGQWKESEVVAILESIRLTK